MPQRIASKTLYLNADKTKFVSEDSPDARFLFVREGSAINESEVARLEKSGVDVKGVTGDDHPDFDARAAHVAEFGEPNAQVEAERKARTAAPANKAKKAAPEDK